MILSYINLSLSLPLFLKSINISSGEDLKKKERKFHHPQGPQRLFDSFIHSTMNSTSARHCPRPRGYNNEEKRQETSKYTSKQEKWWGMKMISSLPK